MKWVRSLGVAVAATACLIVGTPAAAQPVTTQGVACTTLWVWSNTDYAKVCKGWWSVGGGYYDGWVEVKYATSQVYTYIELDRQYSRFTGKGQTRLEEFSHFKEVYINACGPKGCTGNW